MFPSMRIPRPRNAFIIYRQEKSAQAKQDNPALTNLEISKLLGLNWRQECAETRQKYHEKAVQEAKEHQEKYPEYRYTRRRTQDIKRRRIKSQL
jgi:hypothetical protein